MQDRSNSSALAMELQQSCTNPSIWCIIFASDIMLFIIICLQLIILYLMNYRFPLIKGCLFSSVLDFIIHGRKLSRNINSMRIYFRNTKTKFAFSSMPQQRDIANNGFLPYRKQGIVCPTNSIKYLGRLLLTSINFNHSMDWWLRWL